LNEEAMVNWGLSRQKQTNKQKIVFHYTLQHISNYNNIISKTEK